MLARKILGDKMVEVHMATPLFICEQRDTKGMYAKARRSEINDYTGVSSPYEPPLHPDITLKGGKPYATPAF